jgi:CBS domain-containing protein
MTVASVMTTRVVAVDPETPLPELVAKLTETGVGGVPVVNRRGQPLGVVSAADVLPGQGFLPGRGDRRGGRAAELMTTPVRAVHADEPVSFAARLLAKPGVRRLFAVNWDSRLVGVVTRQDLLRVDRRDVDQLRATIIKPVVVGRPSRSRSSWAMSTF